MAKKGKGVGLIIVLAAIAIGSSTGKDKTKEETTQIIPIEAKSAVEAKEDKTYSTRSIPEETQPVETSRISPTPEVLQTLSPEIDEEEPKSTPEADSKNGIVTNDMDIIPLTVVTETEAQKETPTPAPAEAETKTAALKFGFSRSDSNSIGNEWTYRYTVNGEPAKYGDYELTVGDVLELAAEFTEADTKPDIGRSSVTHKVTEDDLKNGFTEEMKLFVTENGGRNSGKSAEFVVTFSFEIK